MSSGLMPCGQPADCGGKFGIGMHVRGGCRGLWRNAAFGCRWNAKSCAARAGQLARHASTASIASLPWVRWAEGGGTVEVNVFDVLFGIMVLCY